MDRGAKIKQLRLEKGWSLQDLGDRLGVGKSTVRWWENGEIASLKAETLKAIADAFGVSPLEFFDSQDADEFFREIEANEPPDHVWVPIVGRVAAGPEMYAEDNIEDYMLVDGQLGLDLQGLLFGLRIAGDSMEPEIKKGSIALVRHQEDADTGDVVIVRVNGEDATCKRIKKTAAGLTLLPANPAYDMQPYTWAEVAEKPVSIIGKVIEVRTKY